MTDKQIRPPYEIALMHDHILRLEEELQAKEQECEELRKQWEFSVAHKIILEKDYNVELNKYKQALTEIKEIAITGFEGFCPKCSRKECEDNNCIETAIRDILQKISEVLNVR